MGSGITLNRDVDFKKIHLFIYSFISVFVDLFIYLSAPPVLSLAEGDSSRLQERHLNAAPGHSRYFGWLNYNAGILKQAGRPASPHQTSSMEMWNVNSLVFWFFQLFGCSALPFLDIFTLFPSVRLWTVTRIRECQQSLHGDGRQLMTGKDFKCGTIISWWWGTEMWTKRGMSV